MLSVSDEYLERMSNLGLSHSAIRLDVNALFYIEHSDTRGFIPADMVAKFTPKAAPVQELIGAGLWRKVKGGYRRDMSDNPISHL